MNRISGETIFVTAELEATNGIIGVNRKGQASASTKRAYIFGTLNNTELAFKLASRANLPGADDLYIKQYQALFQSDQFNEGGQDCRQFTQGHSPYGSDDRGIQDCPCAPGRIVANFNISVSCLRTNSLHQLESLKLDRPVLQQGRKQLLEKLLKENKVCHPVRGEFISHNHNYM